MTEEEPLVSEPSQRPKFSLQLNCCFLLLAGIAAVLQLTVDRPRHWWPRMGWQYTVWFGGLAAVAQVWSVLRNAWQHFCAPRIVADKEAEMSYVCPLGTPVPTNPHAYIDIDIGGIPVGRVIFEVKADVVPRTANNFLALCSGEGTGEVTGEGAGGSSYKGSSFHRVINNFMCQAGITQSGFSSIHGREFDDENFDLDHEGEGVLSMANAGPQHQR